MSLVGTVGGGRRSRRRRRCRRLPPPVTWIGRGATISPSSAAVVGGGCGASVGGVAVVGAAGCEHEDGRDDGQGSRREG